MLSNVNNSPVAGDLTQNDLIQLCNPLSFKAAHALVGPCTLEHIRGQETWVEHYASLLGDLGERHLIDRADGCSRSRTVSVAPRDAG